MSRSGSKARAAVFLDRDGVINVHPGSAYYVKTLAEFKILPGAIEAVRILKRAGYAVWVLSNQSGVSSGEIRREDLDEITCFMEGEFKKNKAELDGVLYCLHGDSDACDCRKPKAGLYLRISQEFDFDFHSSFAVGDSERDLAAGKAVGAKTILVLTGRSKRSDAQNFTIKPDVIQSDLKSAAEWILNQKS